MAIFDVAKCQDAPDSTPSNAGVAGAGILLSFIITACLAIGLSVSIIISDFRGRPATIRKKLLDGYSDSQIMQGIGIQSVGLAKMNTMVPYHFFLIWMLSLLSMATHNATLLALIHDFRRDWVIRWLRQCLMFVNLALSCVCGVFVLQAVAKGLENDTLPIACVWHIDGNGAPSNAGISYVGTIVVIAGNCVIFGLATWYLHDRKQKFQRVIQIAGVLLMLGIAIGATVRIVLLSQAFGEPSVELSDNGEQDWGFGQLLSMLLLILPLVLIVEVYRGEVKLAESTDSGCQRLSDTEDGRRGDGLSHTFQPSPFSNSQTELVKR